MARMGHGQTQREGATLAVLQVATLKWYKTKLQTGALNAPSRHAKKKNGSPRPLAEAVGIALVLRDHASELRRRFEQAYE
eukprot:3238276-Pleurochrysis_carterae.AAC.1